MKSILWFICGACAATLGFFAWDSNRTQPLHLLAPRLDAAWYDHTVVETV